MAKLIAIGAVKTLSSTSVTTASSPKVSVRTNTEEFEGLSDGKVCVEEIWRRRANTSSKDGTDGLPRI